MCGIVGFVDKLGQSDRPIGRIVLTMLEALGCRGPDSAGIAVIRESVHEGLEGIWQMRLTPLDEARHALDGKLQSAGRLGALIEQGATIKLSLLPEPGLTINELEQTLGARAGGLEILCLGDRIDLVKQVGSPARLEAMYGVSTWRGPLAIGHTRMSTESRIDLSHSQPFWVHGLPDMATVHNGHVTNYHQLRRRYEQAGTTFYTDNDSEVIGVYLRDRLAQGRSLPEALEDSLTDLDGSFNYLVASPEGLGVVRDRFGFKPLMLAETEAFWAVATEEVALRAALPGDFRVAEPPPGVATFYPLSQPVPA
jgi:glutamine phosphoribosylpyrophosphate amidotransferase